MVVDDAFLMACTELVYMSANYASPLGDPVCFVPLGDAVWFVPLGRSPRKRHRGDFIFRKYLLHRDDYSFDAIVSELSRPPSTSSLNGREKRYNLE